MAFRTAEIDDDAVALSVLGGEIARTSPYAGHRCFSPAELQAIAVRDVAGRLRDAPRVARVLHERERVAGLAICSALAWDSGYFGMPMARLDFHGVPGLETSAIAGLLEETLDAAVARHGFRHVCCRVGVDDYAFFNAATAAGFRLVDVQRVYVARRNRANTTGSRALFRPRPCRPEDRAALLDLFAQVRFETRYTRDGMLPREKTAGMYRQWIAGMIDAPTTDREIRVLEREGRIVAAGAGRYLDFSPQGIPVRIMTDGIFAGDRGFSGAYVGITRAVVEAGWQQGCVVAELKVSAGNRPANRVLQHLGYENVAQFYSLHKSF
ncbi:MAG: hypothetical protein ACOY33_04795 [Pseudomonadota bacterium]